MARLCLLLLIAILGAGCASTRVTREEPVPESDVAVDEAVAKPAWSPLAEVDLRGGEIPAVLEQALAMPYLRPEPTNCASLAAAIAELDAVLGEDFDKQSATADQDSFAFYVLTSGIRGLIPYYGWIRRLSGADRQQRRALAAVSAGNARRGYLKGLGEARGCTPPASPNRHVVPP